MYTYTHPHTNPSIPTKQQVAVEDPIHKPAAKLTYGELNERISQVLFISICIRSRGNWRSGVEW